jgi:hypothetical protein
MKILLKLLALLALWSLVAGVIVLVDPALLRDVLFPGLYLPFLVILFVAVWYTAALVFKKIGLSLLVSLLLILTVVLSIMQLLFWFVGLGIVLLLGVICYIHFSQ